MYDKLKTHFKKVVPFTDTELDIVDFFFERKILKKKELLLQEGRICNFIAFIAAGSIRHYHTKVGLLSQAVAKYATVSYCPEFLRGSVAENLPWFFFNKRRYAKKDFTSIISKYEENPEYANWKIMSFTYWAWGNQHQSRKFRKQAVMYLDQAIKLDLENNAGRAKAEKLKLKLL